MRAATADPDLRNAIIGEALFHLAMRDPALSPAALAEDLRRLIAQRTGRNTLDFSPARHCGRAA